MGDTEGKSPGGAGADADAVMPLVYRELKSLAKRYFQRRPGCTLQPTEIVHEAFLRLSAGQGGFRDHGHFCAVAALAMRQILTDHARRKRADKRGGGDAPVTLTDAVLAPDGAAPLEALDVLVLDEVLRRLEALDARQARVVEYRVFGGMTVPEVAGVMGISTRSVENDWRLARAWLSRELSSRSSR